MITVSGNRISIRTETQHVVFDGGRLVSLRGTDGREYLRSSNESCYPVQLLYAGGEQVPLAGNDGDSVSVVALNDHRAEIRFESWSGDGIVVVSEDLVTGDVLIQPSGYASRPGLRAVQYLIANIADDLNVIAPFFQGIHLPFEDALIQNTRWSWPNTWEAGLVILQGQGGGFWVHCQDTRYRYKALQVGRPQMPRSLGLQTEAYGPADNSLAAGGLAWRINVFHGDWTVPAARYRDWLNSAWELEKIPRPAGSMTFAWR